MPNDLEIIRQHVLSGNSQAAYDHLMANYRNDDGMRHELLTTIYADPEVKDYWESNPNQGTLGGWGRGGIFEGGDRGRLNEHLAEQDRQEALAEQERIRQQQARNETSSTESNNISTEQNTSNHTGTNNSILNNDEITISEEDENMMNELVNRHAEIYGTGPTPDQIEQFVLPDKLPETGGVSTPALGLDDMSRIVVDELLESQPGLGVDAAEVAAAAILTAIKEDAELQKDFVQGLRDSPLGEVSITGYVDEETLNQVIDFASKAGDAMQVGDIIGSTVDIFSTSAQAHNLVNNMHNMSKEESMAMMGDLLEQQMHNINEFGGSMGMPGYLTSSIELWIDKSDIPGEFNEIVGTLESSDDFVEFAQLMQLPTDEAIPLLKDFAKDKSNAALMGVKTGLSDWASKQANKLGVAKHNLWRSIENRIVIRKQKEAEEQARLTAEKNRQIQYTNKQKAILDNQKPLSSKKEGESWDSHIKGLKKEISSKIVEEAKVTEENSNRYLNILQSSANALGDPDTYPTG